MWVKIEWYGCPEDDEAREVLDKADLQATRSELSGQASVKWVKESPCFRCIHWNGYRWGCELGGCDAA
jgi:hypothetical protein